MITQANVDTLITVFGGSGFLGRHVIRALCKQGYRIRVACRRPDLAGHLQPLGRVGQIHAVQANVRYPGSIGAAENGDQRVVVGLQRHVACSVILQRYLAALWRRPAGGVRPCEYRMGLWLYRGRKPLD